MAKSQRKNQPVIIAGKVVTHKTEAGLGTDRESAIYARQLHEETNQFALDKKDARLRSWKVPPRLQFIAISKSAGSRQVLFAEEKSKNDTDSPNSRTFLIEFDELNFSLLASLLPKEFAKLPEIVLNKYLEPTSEDNDSTIIPELSSDEENMDLGFPKKRLPAAKAAHKASKFIKTKHSEEEREEALIAEQNRSSTPIATPEKASDSVLQWEGPTSFTIKLIPFVQQYLVLINTKGPEKFSMLRTWQSNFFREISCSDALFELYSDFYPYTVGLVGKAEVLGFFQYINEKLLPDLIFFCTGKNFVLSEQLVLSSKPERKQFLGRLTDLKSEDHRLVEFLPVGMPLWSHG